MLASINAYVSPVAGRGVGSKTTKFINTEVVLSCRTMSHKAPLIPFSGCWPTGMFAYATSEIAKMKSFERGEHLLQTGLEFVCINRNVYVLFEGRVARRRCVA